MSQWIYFLGARSGADVKIGRSKDRDLRVRVASVSRSQTTSEEYVVLAGVVGTPKDETALHTAFAGCRRVDKGSRREYFHAVPEVVEYVNWLRAQWFTTPDGAEPLDSLPVVDPDFWLPDPSRRIAPPEFDPTKLVQDHETKVSPLSGTPWSWMVNPRSSIQDYFTPPELVDAAREAMGGIDLDAASHYLANRRHKIPDYFHVNRSAFENRWHGRVWLNPPYGDNAPWFDAILQYVESWDIEQLCMLSPMWTFTTKIARPVMEVSSAFLLLSPTPKFWGNSDPTKTGRNDPHGIMYIGGNAEGFIRAYRAFGIPLELRWDLLDEDGFVPQDIDDDTT